MRINLVITLEAFLDCLARGICASGLVHHTEYGFIHALKIAKSMGFDCAPTELIGVDCGELWLECFKFHQRYETTTACESYAELARTSVGELMSASLAAVYR